MLRELSQELLRRHDPNVASRERLIVPLIVRDEVIGVGCRCEVGKGLVVRVRQKRLPGASELVVLR